MVHDRGCANRSGNSFIASGAIMQFVHFLSALTLVSASPALAAIPHAAAERAVADVRAALERDGGRLWGVNLAGPILFADPATHDAVATDADSTGALVRDGTRYIGALPREINVANTALRWGVRLWSMVMLQRADVT